MGRMQCSICPDLQNEAAWSNLHFFACRTSQSVYTSQWGNSKSPRSTPRQIFKPSSLQCIMCITRLMQMRRGSSKIKPRKSNLNVRHCVLSSVIGLFTMQRLRSPPSQQQKGGHPVRSIASHMERRQMRNHQMGSFLLSLRTLLNTHMNIPLS
jgi:hypothetical protein